MKNIRLIIAYDGSSYHGWQDAKSGPSVEGELRNVLEQVLQHKITLQAASRTDAGVHARHQVVNFFTNRVPLHTEKLLISLNSLLPGSVAVVSVDEVDQDFHPTLHCTSKEYRYYICNSTWQYPEYRDTSWHYPSVLDVEKMEAAAKNFVGVHDFSAFTNVKKNETYEDHIRQILDVSIDRLPRSRLCIRVKGVKFLYKMVRNIVGTIVYVGTGKITVDEVDTIFAKKNRIDAGVTAPAHGLFLHSITYTSK